MSASITLSHTGLFDRFATKAPPVVIAATAAFAAFETAPLLSAYLHTEPAPIAADAPSATPEPIATPDNDAEATPLVRVTPRPASRVTHHPVKHVHHRQKATHHERAHEVAERQVGMEAADASPVNTFVRPGGPIPLTSSDFFLRLFRGFGQGE